MIFVWNQERMMEFQTLEERVAAFETPSVERVFDAVLTSQEI